MRVLCYHHHPHHHVLLTVWTVNPEDKYLIATELLRLQAVTTLTCGALPGTEDAHRARSSAVQRIYFYFHSLTIIAHSLRHKHTFLFLENRQLCVISGFRLVEDDNCALLGCYAASNGNFF